MVNRMELICQQWGLVIAGISDLSRPAEKLSLTQNGALMATGAIWTRWCMIITPRNMLYVLSQIQTTDAHAHLTRVG